MPLSLFLGLSYVRLQPQGSVLRAASRLIGGVPKLYHNSAYMRDTALAPCSAARPT